jgi:P27 family predicted phage terminase small subunit
MPRGPRAKVKVSTVRVPTGEKGYIPPMPTGMPERAAAKWAELVPMIAAQVQLRDVDGDALQQYCEAVAVREKATAELHEPGVPLLMTNPNGAAFPNPLLKVIKEADALMTRLSVRFGLDPQSRERLKMTTPAKGAGALAELLARGRNRPRPQLA